MAEVLEQEAPAQETPAQAAPRQVKDAQAEEIARDLALMDEMEAFFSALTKNTPPLRDDAVARSYDANFAVPAAAAGT